MREALADSGDNDAIQMIDSASIRAHHRAAGARGAANPKVMCADKGCDTDDTRGGLRARGAPREIPTNRTCYAMRNKIERFFRWLKESRRVVTGNDHTSASFLGFTKRAAIKT